MALLDGLDDITAIRHVDGARQTVDHFVSDALGHVAAELSLFALILLPETGLNRLLHVLAADFASLLNNVQEDFLGALISAQTMLSRVADIAARDIGSSLNREGDAVGNLATPT